MPERQRRFARTLRRLAALWVGAMALTFALANGPHSDIPLSDSLRYFALSLLPALLLWVVARVLLARPTSVRPR